MGAIISTIVKLLGFGNGQSATNTVNGVVNIGLLAGVAGWAYEHWGETLTFSMSVGTLTLIAGFAYVVIELNRRT